MLGEFSERSEVGCIRSLAFTLLTEDGSETFRADADECGISFTRSSSRGECYVAARDPEGLDRVLMIAGKAANAERPSGDISDDAGVKFSYELSAVDENGCAANFAGEFATSSLPAKWADVISSAGDLLRGVARFELIGGGRSVPRDCELTYCKVRVAGHRDTLYYRSTLRELKIGDAVLIPYGMDDAERVGTVAGIEFYSPDEAPYPPEKTKFIISVMNSGNMRKGRKNEVGDN